MSQGRAHDFHVMIKNSSTLAWQFDSSRRYQLRRVPISGRLKNDSLSQDSPSEGNWILPGMDFSLDALKTQRWHESLPVHQIKPKSPLHHPSDQEPLWVSVLGGLSLVVGLLMIWVLG